MSSTASTTGPGPASAPGAPALAPALLPAPGPHHRPEVVEPAVVGVHLHGGAVGAGAEVDVVLQQAAPAAHHAEDELGDRGVGDGGEGGADAAAPVGVDAADQLDLDLAAQVGDQVGELVVGGAQVDRPVEGIGEQRADRAGVAVDRALRALIGGELHPGADRA